MIYLMNYSSIEWQTFRVSIRSSNFVGIKNIPEWNEISNVLFLMSLYVFFTILCLNLYKLFYKNLPCFVHISH